MINDEEHTVSIDMLGPVTLKYMISVLMPHWKRYQYRNKDRCCSGRTLRKTNQRSPLC